MSRAPKILKTARASPSRVTFADLQRLVEAAGFVLARVSGSRHVYKRAGLPEIIDLQPSGKDAKTYQVRQVLDLIDKYDLRVE